MNYDRTDSHSILEGSQILGMPTADKVVGWVDYVTRHAVSVYKENPMATLPTYGTEYSSCFDLAACLDHAETVKYWNKKNESGRMDITEDGSIWLDPGERALIPTGLIFDLKVWQDLRLHPRSSVALKHGVTLVNAEGIVDPDYVEQTFVGLINLSKKPFKISHGDRIAQGEILMRSHANFMEQPDRPQQKTDRNGGVGSTGK